VLAHLSIMTLLAEWKRGYQSRFIPPSSRTWTEKKIPYIYSATIDITRTTLT